MTERETTLSEEQEEELDALFDQQFVGAFTVFCSEVQNNQLMCRIFDEYLGPDSRNHNCLGCNLDDRTEQVAKFLAVMVEHPGLFSLDQGYGIYVHLLNVIREQVSDVFELISLPAEYRGRHFRVFDRVRCWANFFKHPKEFGWLVHHPKYTIEGSDHAVSCTAGAHCLRVDDDFVRKFYSSGRTRGLARAFDGKEDRVVVVLPDLKELTEEFCVALERFVDVVTQNPVYHDILGDRSTLIGYLEAEESEEE